MIDGLLIWQFLEYHVSSETCSAWMSSRLLSNSCDSWGWRCLEMHSERKDVMKWKCEKMMWVVKYCCKMWDMFFFFSSCYITSSVVLIKVVELRITQWQSRSWSLIGNFETETEMFLLLAGVNWELWSRTSWILTSVRMV